MMAQLRTGFLPVDRQLFDLDVGEAMGLIVRQKYSSAKHLARAWKIQLSTAENVFKGTCSGSTLTKAFKAEGWAIIAALGATITGETFEQYEERRFSQIIREAEDARQNILRMAARRAEVESRAAGALDAFDRSLVDQERRQAGAARQARGGSRHQPPREA